MRRKTLHFALLFLLAVSGCKAKRAITADPAFDDPKTIPDDPGASAAYLVVSGSSSHNFGNKYTGTTTEVELTLVNEGVQSADAIAVATDLSAPFKFKGAGGYPGTGGTCGATLSAETSCSMFVLYEPTVTGTFADTFVLEYESDGDPLEFTYGVLASSGTATLTITGSPTYTFANTLIGDTIDHTFTITNTGALTARFMTDSGLLAAPFSYKGDVYPGTGGTCTAELSASATCTIVLTFTATTPGLAIGAWGLGFVTGGAAGAVGLSLNGSSGTADITITNPTGYTYANTVSGNTTDRTFTLTNVGDYDATALQDLGELASPFNYATGAYPGGGTCGATLAPAASCTIIIRFTPVANLYGTMTDTLELSYFDGELTQSIEVPLTGLAQSALLQMTMGTTYDLGLVAKGTTTDYTMTIENIGNYSATSISITDNLASPPATTTPIRYKGNTYPGTGGNCGTTILAGASCTVVMQYVPPNSGGTAVANHSDTTNIRYVPGAGVTTVNLLLTVSGRAGLGTLTFSSGAAGTRVNGSSYAMTITVTNGGSYSSTSIAVDTLMAAPFTFTGGSYPGTSGTCGSELSPGGSCQLRLTFNPVLVGVYAESLILGYSTGLAASTATLSLTGTSALAVLTISDHPSWDFGSVSYNQSNTSRTFTVTNSGGWAASSLSQSGLAAPFSRTGGTCGVSLAAGATCTHIVRFTPTADGPAATDTMNISYNDGQTAGQILSMDFDGTGLNVAPVANAQSPSFVQDSGANAITLTSSDVNGNPRTYEIRTLPSNGTLSVGMGVLGSPTFTYTPNGGYNGPDSFTFRVNDGLLDSPDATVSITVTP